MAVDVPEGSDGDTGLSPVFQKSQQKPDRTHTTAAQGKRVCFRLGLQQQQQGYINPGAVGVLTAQRRWQRGLSCVNKNTQGTNERFKNTVSLVLMMKKLRFKIPFA